jgi:hypothetical protein
MKTMLKLVWSKSRDEQLGKQENPETTKHGTTRIQLSKPAYYMGEWAKPQPKTPVLREV